MSPVSHGPYDTHKERWDEIRKLPPDVQNRARPWRSREGFGFDVIERRTPAMRRFVVYRRDITPGTERFPAAAYNDPGAPQVEGVLFRDGIVACRWLTAHRSTAVWDSFADFEAIHGHPEYGTEIVWLDD